MDEEAFERLRAWRWQRAAGMPAYTVAADAVLEEVLRRRPRSVEALIEIHGIGPAFCNKHGRSLLAELNELEQAADGGAGSRVSSALDRALASPTRPA